MLVIIRCRIFVFQLAIQNYKYYDIQNYNFACCFSWCEKWSLTMREERRLRVHVKRVLKKIFGPKRDESRGAGWVGGRNYIMGS